VGVLVVRLGEEHYVKWSNTTDAPVSCVMGRDELIRQLESDEQVAFSQAVHLLDVADETGTSDADINLASLLANNRAGPDERRLTVDEIVRQYRCSG
jgi:hypothetical protein